MEQNSGRLGEHLAAEFLQDRGYRILEKNFRVREGEIDIIAYDTSLNELVFVEVKTRKTDYFGRPEEFVSPAKLGKIKKAALYYLNQHPSKNWRIDIIAVITRPDVNIEHFINITS